MHTLTQRQAAWDDFIAHQPHVSFLQSWAWGEMQKILGVPYERLVVDTGQPQAAALVLTRRIPWSKSWLYIPRGPIFSTRLPDAEQWSLMQREFDRLAKEQDALFVRCDPAWPATAASLLTAPGWKQAERDVQPRATVIIDLTKSDEELLGAMHQKTRYNIRLAEKKGVQVRFGTEVSDLEIFLGLKHQVEERSAFRYHPEAYYRAMHQALGTAGMFVVAIAEHDGTPLAAHLLISFAGTTTYVHGASASSKRHLMAPHLLQWTSMQWARQQGAQWYDLYGIAPADASPHHPWAGITKFKLGFGGQREEYIGAWDYIYEPAWYAGFTLARRVRKLVQ